ncbi:MAG: carboxypeptidase-like regulatory domain-containing protein, partial [Melioribacteraceae bacterium]
MKKIFILITLLPLLVSFAQSGTIKGKVITNENEPLINANVIIIGTQLGAATLPDGTFEIKNVPFGQYTIETSLIGYGKNKKTILLNAKTKPITIILTEEA